MAKKRKTEEKSFTNDEELSTLLKIKQYKDICEENIIGILYKEPDLFFYYDRLSLDNFTSNKWKLYFQIGQSIVIKERKILDENTIDIYLNKHSDINEKYQNYGGYEVVREITKNAKKENIEGYIKELEKWEVVTKMAKAKFPVAHRLKDFVDMDVEEIYAEQEALLNHIFLDIDDEDKVYKLSDGIDELIDKLDEGFSVGLPLAHAPNLTDEIGGLLLGNVTLVGGLSGVGKTSISRVWLLPSIIEKKERLVVMINEEGIAKWQREMLVYVANNVFSEDVQKYKVRNGNYTKEFKSFLKDKCAKWIKDNEDNIVIKPFKKYTTEKAIRCIRKYANLGCKYFMLDTFKADNNSLSSEAFWFNMQQSMVDIYNEVKEENKNVHILVTFQLAKSSSKNRYYTQDNIGLAKNIIDVASTCIMVRSIFEDEFEGGKAEIKVFKKKGKTQIPVKLDRNKYYIIIFITKNREGASNQYQIVAECDLSRNTFKEVGYCCLSPDF